VRFSARYCCSQRSWKSPATSGRVRRRISKALRWSDIWSLMFLFGFEGARVVEGIDGEIFVAPSERPSVQRAASFDALLDGLHSISMARATISAS
jgi:hypothetical protein